jgi:hypothetical protein
MDLFDQGFEWFCNMPLRKFETTGTGTNAAKGARKHFKKFEIQAE